jgi:hypothetical protein
MSTADTALMQRHNPAISRYSSEPWTLSKPDAAMSSAPTLGSHSLEHSKDSPEIPGIPVEQPFRFLDLEPELRNQIYEQTFFAEAQTSFSGLAPHALTRVSQQVRRESLGLYYSSVETLEIPLYDEKNVGHVREWMAESSLQHYPVLPEITFATTANFRIDSEPVPNTVRPIFHFKRQTMVPAEEFEGEFVPTRDGPDMYVAAYLVAPAYLAAQIRCLGLSSMVKITNQYNTFIGRRSQRFTNAIVDHEAWTTRHLDMFPVEPPRGLRRVVCLWVSKPAHRNEGSTDWGEADVRELVGFFELISQMSEGEKPTVEQLATYLRGLFNDE